MSKWLLRMAPLVIGAVLMSPAVLWAHARLTRSDPAAGARLELAPHTRCLLWSMSLRRERDFEDFVGGP